MQDLLWMFQAMTPLRAAASDAAEMVSQLLFGDLLQALDQDRQWLKVRNQADGYEGWIDEKSVLACDEALLNQIEAWEYVQADCLTLNTHRAGADLPLRLSLGARLPRLKQAVTSLHIADWRLDLPAVPAATLDQQPVQAVLAYAARYLGTPYLWGGKSLAGIDCSGLTQMCFAMAGLQLPRDAKDQALVGEEVAYTDRAAGDLAFFDNAAGKVIHVGIVLPDGNLRHASGHVHDAALLESGIVGKYTGKQTHRLCSIKRIT